MRYARASRDAIRRSKAERPSVYEIWLTSVIAINDFVIDPSVAAKWFLPDEATADAEAILARIEHGDTAIAPELFRWEIENLLLHAERAGRIDAADVDDAMSRLRDLPIHLQPGPDRLLTGAALALARAYELTAYDAAYLVCADDLNLELVTADVPLSRAAQDLGLTVTLIR